jgi:hypothetical protein
MADGVGDWVDRQCGWPSGAAADQTEGRLRRTMSSGASGSASQQSSARQSHLHAQLVHWRPPQSIRPALRFLLRAAGCAAQCAADAAAAQTEDRPLQLSLSSHTSTRSRTSHSEQPRSAEPLCTDGRCWCRSGTKGRRCGHPSDGRRDGRTKGKGQRSRAAATPLHFWTQTHSAGAVITLLHPGKRAAAE